MSIKSIVILVCMYVCSKLMRLQEERKHHAWSLPVSEWSIFSGTRKRASNRHDSLRGRRIGMHSASMTWEQVEDGARANRPGFKVVRKLLTDKRFDK